MACKMADTNHEEELVESFRTFDRDGNGLIGQSDLEYILLNIGVNVGKSEVQAMIDAVDSDKDEHLNYSDFVKVMMKK